MAQRDAIVLALDITEAYGLEDDNIVPLAAHIRNEYSDLSDAYDRGPKIILADYWGVR